ncbi:hypothetical protein [Capnocytophaga granulosa]|jgi:hypothetical protein|uniref:hypothetical protein n=1 Tax=Capnocytophaga granulosa TaxID=45242 RepID=UPI0023F29278|nr:hypothetical protein [Capnocytophaga granulosa]
MMKVISKLRGNDKLLHSKYGNMLFVGIFLVAVLFLSVGKSLLIAAITLGTIGLCKGTYIDWWDIVASFIPYTIIKYINR